MPCMLCAPLSNSTPRMSVVTIIWGVNAKMNDRKEPHVVCALSEHVLVVHDGDEEVHRVRHRNVAHGKIRRKVSIRVLKVIVRFPVPLEKLVVVLVFDVQLPIDTKLVAFLLSEVDEDFVGRMDEKMDGKRVSHLGDKSDGRMDEMPKGLALVERAPRFREVVLADSGH